MLKLIITFAIAETKFTAQHPKTFRSGRFDFFSTVEPIMQIILIPQVFELLVRVGMQLILLRRSGQLLLLCGNQRHSQIEHVVFVLFVDVEVEDLIDQRQVHISKFPP
jgi:hypothetical protein